MGIDLLLRNIHTCSHVEDGECLHMRAALYGCFFTERYGTDVAVDYLIGGCYPAV